MTSGLLLSPGRANETLAVAPAGFHAKEHSSATCRRNLTGVGNAADGGPQRLTS